ncbi:hypothetical protein [Spirillospora sp. NPDC029432]|uniref:hypothetical protein n=1 Tax=Spirillospora sp. NPDC029432 TaxID=3154599 RepID=UPI0034522C0F
MPRTYLRLPVDADEGFPQSFRLQLGTLVYLVELYVNVAEERAAEGGALDLLGGDAFLVARVLREDSGRLVPLLHRKVARGLEYAAGELSLVFKEAVVDVRNLNGVGAYGSRVVAGVAAR